MYDIIVINYVPYFKDQACYSVTNLAHPFISYSVCERLLQSHMMLACKYICL